MPLRRRDAASTAGGTPALRKDLVRYNASVRILISAGEASGDMYGALLIEALRRLAGESPATTLNQRLEFFGAGGDRMRAAGCGTGVDSKQPAGVGITENFYHLSQN